MTTPSHSPAEPPPDAGRELLSPVWTHLADRVVDRADGIHVWTRDGSRFIDFTSGIGVTSTGHCHPRVVEAIREQAERLIFSQINCMIPPTAPRLAARLRSLMPAELDSFFFSNSGAEAVEAAVKLAKHATGRTNVIAFQGGFHGRTHLTMALTGSKTVYRKGYQPLPSGVFFAPYPYAFRHRVDEQEDVDRCLRELELLLRSQTAPDETAAILIEPILGEGGYVPAPARFLRELRSLCDRHDILLLLDEVQSGFGRTGEWWAHDHAGIRPDILVMAKGIASGMPLSAIAAPAELMARWTRGTHGGTYGGGNAVVAAAAIATIDTIEEEGLVENARRQGTHLLEGLSRLQARHPTIGDVRGRGLMVATELVDGTEPDADAARRLSAACLERGLMLLSCGSYENVIRWIPPLIVSREQVDEALETFAAALDEVAGASDTGGERAAG